MKPLAFVLLFAIATAVAQEAPHRESNSAWLSSVLTQIDSIKPGMTRADLEKLFGHDGGISNARQDRYVLRDCSLIKVDVEFAASDVLRRQPTDKILKISLPYLQRFNLD